MQTRRSPQHLPLGEASSHSDVEWTVLDFVTLLEWPSASSHWGRVNAKRLTLLLTMLTSQIGRAHV